MARLRQRPDASGRSILLVDDDAEYLQTACRALEREGHEVLSASHPADGLALLRTREVDLVLVDYLMPCMTGAEFVAEMRTFCPSTQVILQTGYASEHPPRELLRRLDIQGFHDKSDGPDKLALWVDVGLKAAYATNLLLKSRQGLRYVLDVTPALHRMQPLESLLQGILLQTAGLLGATNSFLAASALKPGDVDETLGDTFVAIAEPGEDFTIRAATGRFQAGITCESSLDDVTRQRLADGMSEPGVTTTSGGTIAPLRVGTRTLGAIYLDRAIVEAWENELLELFANQAAVAIHNVSLYEMAAHDAVTGVATRRIFEQSLDRELRASQRSGRPVGVVLVDVDDMKLLNDSHGHSGGDRGLAAVASALRQAVRATDVVGRIGGDEFAVLLPDTDAAGAVVVIDRVRHALRALAIDVDGCSVTVRASAGAALLEGREAVAGRPEQMVFLSLAKALVTAADEAMYAHKRGCQERDVRMLAWPESQG